eukprot:1374546-Prymnesium_polylepis.1
MARALRLEATCGAYMSSERSDAHVPTARISAACPASSPSHLRQAQEEATDQREVQGESARPNPKGGH